MNVAWAFEKHNKLDSALSFARQAYETTLSLGGEGKPHIHCLAHACAGRVLARLELPDDSAREFEAAVTSANPPAMSARLALFEALALRDYYRVATTTLTFGWDAEAIRQRLETTLADLPLTMAELEPLLF